MAAARQRDVGGSMAAARRQRLQEVQRGSDGARRQRVSAAEVAVVVVAQRSGAFERHRRDDVLTFILGQGWRDDGAVNVIVIGSD